MIEAGIREKEKDVRNWSPYGTMPWIQQPANNVISSHNINRDRKSEDVSFINFLKFFFSEIMVNRDQKSDMEFL